MEKGLEEGGLSHPVHPTEGKGWALWAELLLPGPQVLRAVVTGLWEVSWGQQLHCFLFGSQGLPAGRVSWAPQATAALCLYVVSSVGSSRNALTKIQGICRANIPSDLGAVVWGTSIKPPPPAGPELADTRAQRWSWTCWVQTLLWGLCCHPDAGLPERELWMDSLHLLWSKSNTESNAQPRLTRSWWTWVDLAFAAVCKETPNQQSFSWLCSALLLCSEQHNLVVPNCCGSGSLCKRTQSREWAFTVF